MGANMGTIDRVIRGVLGLVLLGLAVFGQTTGLFTWLVPVIGIVLLITSSVRVCPAYKLIGIDTRPK